MTDQTPSYQPQQLEEKWQTFWLEQKLFQQTEVQKTEDQKTKSQKTKDQKDKLYLLFAFAYPSGSGLHVGHVESKTALDILARHGRMNGKKVFFPVGWDAFGLPAENYAIKTGVHPEKTTTKAIDTFRRQLQRIGISYDWANEIATCHPDYYQWTQWLFLQLYEAGLAFRDTGKVNWCPSCQTVLANEQVVEGLCERCDSEVSQKQMKQWYFKITDYKDELIEGLEEVDWPEPTKKQQLNWIGKKKGAEISFELAEGELANSELAESKLVLKCFTTRPDTIFGATFIVISPEKFDEFDLLAKVPAAKKEAVASYVEQAFKKTEEERQVGEKDKTGVKTGLEAINPVNGEAIPIYVADYVLGGYGTGVVMGVPAHDERDFAFAKKHDLEIKQVIEWPEEKSAKEDLENYDLENYDLENWQDYYADYGVMVNSGEFDGLSFSEAMEKLPVVFGQAVRPTVTYKLRDWLISRQRYWGAPIPIVYDPDGRPHPVKKEHLPWKLSTDVDFKPTGESPLRSSQEFKERTERLYGEGWTPEYDTMDTFVDSSWYFLRYVSARNEAEFADPEQLKKWLPVDFYMIGPEHIVLHLLYSRFFTKFLRDEGHLDFLQTGEPFAKMRHQGMILGPDGKKMSKSKGNVVNPDAVVEEYGADTLRMYEMFMGPIEADKPWDTSAVVGVYRFLSRVYRLVMVRDRTNSSREPKKTQDKLEQKLHQTIKKVSQDIPQLKFNTAIAVMMEFVNLWSDCQQARQQVSQQTGSSLPESSSKAKPALLELVLSEQDLIKFLKILAPFAPFVSEELYQELHQKQHQEASGDRKEMSGAKKSVHLTSWPEWDPALAQEEQVSLPVQVNGKVRAEVTVDHDQVSDEKQVLTATKKLKPIKDRLEGKKLVKEIYVEGRIVSLVVK